MAGEGDLGDCMYVLYGMCVEGEGGKTERERIEGGDPKPKRSKFRSFTTK